MLVDDNNEDDEDSNDGCKGCNNCCDCCNNNDELCELLLVDGGVGGVGGDPVPPLTLSTILLRSEVVMVIALLPVAAAWSRSLTMMMIHAHRLVALSRSESRLIL